MNRSPIAVISGSRTPFVKAFTDLHKVSAVELGRLTLLETVRRAGISVKEVDEVIFGNVSGPPDAANIARVIAMRSRVPNDRVAHTVNRNCASGMESILAGWSAIEQGRAKIVVAGGTESMSNVPLLYSTEAASIWMHLARSKSIWQRMKTISRFRPRHFKPIFGIELGLTDPVCGLNMAETAAVLADDFSITRDQQDRFAMESHRKAEAAQRECYFSGETVPVSVSDDVMITKDNAIRYGQSMESLARLRPIVKDGGSITAGNSCPISDGAATVLLTRVEHVKRLEIEPLGYVTAYAIAGCDPRRMGLGPVYATARLLSQTGLSLDDFDRIEINEAFAAQVLACERAFASRSFAEKHLARNAAIGEIDPKKLNVHGGALALGHPVGSTGTRLILTLLRSLRASGKRRGLATLCVGGGQGVAMVVETEREKS